MNNPFEYWPGKEIEEAWKELSRRIEGILRRDAPEDADFCREMKAGKMLGILIAEDEKGVRHPLFAFSGQLGASGFHYPGFVEPVFDYLVPDGYFKTREREISLQTKEIAEWEYGPLAAVQKEYEEQKLILDAEIAAFKTYINESKVARGIRRAHGVGPEEEGEMIRQSQFEKAELVRLKKRVALELQPYARRLEEARNKSEYLREKRRHDSEALQRWLFDHFLLLNAKGESRSLSDVFADTPLRTPPSGAGECCAPKLLQAAYRRGWKPVEIAEYWYGAPKGGEIRIHGHHYPACRGKCLPVLEWMLQGIEVTPRLNSSERMGKIPDPEIIFENEWFCVVNKPAGMLSVPGKGVLISVEQWLQRKYGAEKCVRMVHRLDQDTSGLLIAAFGLEAYTVLQQLFATRRVKKRYVAVLDACSGYGVRGSGDDVTRVGCKGRIELPLMADWLDRPRQRVDFEHGKEAITEYEVIGEEEGNVRIWFYPLTGRTHQLRVHAASSLGLGMPIVGDRLYGTRGEGMERLHLHAERVEFVFPLDGRDYRFEVAPGF